MNQVDRQKKRISKLENTPSNGFLLPKAHPNLSDRSTPHRPPVPLPAMRGPAPRPESHRMKAKQVPACMRRPSALERIGTSHERDWILLEASALDLPRAPDLSLRNTPKSLSTLSSVEGPAFGGSLGLTSCAKLGAEIQQTPLSLHKSRSVCLSHSLASSLSTNQTGGKTGIRTLQTSTSNSCAILSAMSPRATRDQLKIGSKMGGEFTYPRIVPLVLTHGQVFLLVRSAHALMPLAATIRSPF